MIESILLPTLSVLPPLPQTPNVAETAEDVREFLQLIRWQGVFASVLLVAAASVLLHFTRKFVESLSQTFTTSRLLFQRIAAFFQLAVHFSTILAVVLLSFRLSDQVMVAIGGSLAVAVGFATKDLVASFVGGIMILLDRPFQVGDRVNFGGHYGDVTTIGLRSVKLQTLDDNTVTVPNNKFLTEISSSGNYGALDMQVAITFYIGLDQDVSQASDLVEEATATSRFVHLPRPIVVLVEQVIVDSYIALRLTMKAYVLDTQYEKAFVTDITLRVMEAFRTHDIQPPAVLHRSTPSAPSLIHDAPAE